MPCPSHPPSFGGPNNIWWNIQVMKLLIMQSSSASRHFLLGSNILLCTLFSNTHNLCSSHSTKLLLLLLLFLSLQYVRDTSVTLPSQHYNKLSNQN
jgi:hypothetical protein